MNDFNHDIEYLQRCRQLIEGKLNWRPVDEWRNYEFTELGEKIFDTTDVRLSPTTLKRVFGKLKYESLPSSTTLNVLAKYTGYESWMDFKAQTTYSVEGLPAEIKLPAATKKKTFLKNKKWMAVTALIAVCIIPAIAFLPRISSTPIKNAESIVFESKPIADGIPNSVVFTIDLKGNKPDQVTIQQSWDSTKTIHLQPGQTEATGIYYMPGYFRAKLILDGKIIKQHDLYIKSDKWMATIDHQPIPTYLKKDELVFDNKMRISNSVLSAIKNNSAPVYLTYHLVKPFGGLQSDNFTLETGIKNIDAEGPAVCKTAKIFILCSKGAFIVPFTIPGCISDINFMANDNYFDGKSNDLSCFSADLSEWSPVKVEVKNHRMEIFLNNKLVREEVYKKDAGEVVGLRFSFLGAGAVDHVRLLDGKGNIAYSDDFKSK
jgi:hypothetical protein